MPETTKPDRGTVAMNGASSSRLLAALQLGRSQRAHSSPSGCAASACSERFPCGCVVCARIAFPFPSSFQVLMGSPTMSALNERPIDRACAKREELERELKKCPDFQLYLMATSPKDRSRMERLLMEVPSFRLWHLLSNSIRQETHNRLDSTSTRRG